MKYSSVCFLLLIFSGCQTATQKQNIQEVQNVEKENVVYLTQVHNLVLLTQRLSELAMGEAELRSTYLIAEQTHTLVSELLNELEAKAGSQKLNLEDELNTTNAQYLVELQQIPQEDFDKIYYQYMLSNLSRTIELSNDYLKYGRHESLLNLAGMLQKQMIELKERFEQSDAF